MSFPQYPAFLQQVRGNDPTRVTGFVANILETPIAKEERLRAHRVSALKLYHAACLKDKAQREAQEAADAVRAASKAKREVERNRRHQEAKAKAARAGAFHPHSAKTEASSPAIQQLDSERLVERVRTLEGEIDHLSGRNAELESRIEAMKLETDSLKQLNSGVFRIPLRPQQNRHRLVRRTPPRAGRDELNHGPNQKAQQSLSAKAR